jgi:farnesyl diphosphate synthase
MSASEPSLRQIDLTASIKRIAADLDTLFDAMLSVPDDPRSRLFNAMRHAAIGGGKRIRPLLVCASAELFDVSRARALRAGLAVECIHVQSLIHDDLPCMDDDDMRRGKATVHVAFDEATAVLAGDSLLALAFEILTDDLTHPSAQVRSELACELARAAGAEGMAGGQMLDLLPSEAGMDVEAVARLQRLKTGTLIGWSVEAGAILGSASPEHRTSLRGYAQNLGLAFQIADDLLDVEGDAAVVGKRVGKDEEQGKATLVTLLGPDRARQQAAYLAQQAIDHLHCFEGRAGLLVELAEFAVRRNL